MVIDKEFGVYRKCENRGQMKIMQMSFMIIGVFFFFVLAGLFFLGITLNDVSKNANELAQERASSSIEVIAAMPELSYGSRDSMVIDEDKLRVMMESDHFDYEDFWPVASVEVYKVYPAFKKKISCPASECNYYNVYDSGQSNIKKISSYVSICRRVKDFGSVYDRCDIGKIVVGVRIREPEDDK